MKQPPFITRLIDIARESPPFTGSDGRVYVSGPSSPGCALPVRSPAHRNWFYFRVYAKYDTIPTANAYHAILNLLESQAAAYESHRLPVSRRIASAGAGSIPARVLLHLANNLSQYAEIAPDGWKVTSSNHVIFETSRSTCALPRPA